MKQISQLQKVKVKKEDILEVQKEILNNINYFKDYDINSVSTRGSNLLHFMISFGITDCIDILVDQKIDIFKKNKSGMFPISYAKKMKDVTVLLSLPSIKNDKETYNKLHKLLYCDVISPLYFFKPKEFKEFLNQNKDMLSTLNDNNITFLFNIEQILSIKLKQQYELFKKEHNINFSNEEIYLYVIDKVHNNKNIDYSIAPYTITEHKKLSEFSAIKEEILKYLINTVKLGKELPKITKLNVHKYDDFYLHMSYEYEQVEFLQEQYKKVQSTMKKGKSTYIEDYEYIYDLLYAWKDYISEDKVSTKQLKQLCEDNGLYGINVSPVFSLKFINSLIEMFKKETLKVFPVEDGKLFANNAYLKIQSNFGQSSGYLRFAVDKHIININVSDYSQQIDNVFPEDIENLKRSFVHEYTHFLQVVSENTFNLNFKTNNDWLKIQNVLLETTTVKEELLDKLINVLLEEFSRNYIEFSDDDKLIKHLYSIDEINNKNEIADITKKVIALMPTDQRTPEFKNYIKNNLCFMYQCLREDNTNLQKLYLEKLNRDENLKNYYNDPVEIHARLNEHLLKLKNVDLLRDFNFLSDEDNQYQKKLVLKDLKKFNQLILQHFEKIKQKNNTLKMK